MEQSGVAEAWAEALKAFAARDRLARTLQSGATALQEMREDLALVAAEAAALAEAVAEMQAQALEQRKKVEELGTGAATATAAGALEGNNKEVEKLKRELAVARKRFEKEEKLAAERGADIEDLTERLKALQSASRSFDQEASNAEQREKRSRECARMRAHVRAAVLKWVWVYVHVRVRMRMRMRVRVHVRVCMSVCVCVRLLVSCECVDRKDR